MHGTKVFIDKAVMGSKSIFVWLDNTGLHFWPHIKKEAYDETDIGIDNTRLYE